MYKNLSFSGERGYFFPRACAASYNNIHHPITIARRQSKRFPCSLSHSLFTHVIRIMLSLKPVGYSNSPARARPIEWRARTAEYVACQRVYSAGRENSYRETFIRELLSVYWLECAHIVCVCLCVYTLCLIICSACVPADWKIIEIC